jgi:hypothetical protein
VRGWGGWRFTPGAHHSAFATELIRTNPSAAIPAKQRDIDDLFVDGLISISGIVDSESEVRE